MAIITTTLDRLKSQLLTSGLSQSNNALFQVIDQLITFLRDVTTTVNSLSNPDASSPYAEITSSVNQTPVVTTPIQITFNSSGLLNKFNFGANSLTVTENGIYRALFTGQIGETNNGQVNIDAWFRINGTDVPNSNNRHFVSLNSDAKVLVVDTLISMKVGDILTMFMSVDNATRVAGLIALTPAGEPAIPSAMLAVDKISN
jgi:hypothetical protein